MYSIIVSKRDIAGMNIADKLIDNFGFKEKGREFDGNKIYEKGNFQLVFINEFQVYADYVDKLETELLVFASRHSSKTGLATLTVHAIGNWGRAELGGKERQLVPCSAITNKSLIVNLFKEAKEEGIDWPVTLETVHHGPYLTKPAVFIEIGSSENEWKNDSAGKAVACAIMGAFGKNKKYRIALGVGDIHYCHIFTKIMLQTDIAIGHILPKYYLDLVDFETFKQASEKVVEPIDFALFDWKNINIRQREKIIGFCEQLNLKYEKASKFL